MNDISTILITLFLAINQSFFMGFFFMISSYFNPGSVDRKGSTAFLVDRLKRLFRVRAYETNWGVELRDAFPPKWRK